MSFTYIYTYMPRSFTYVDMYTYCIYVYVCAHAHLHLCVYISRNGAEIVNFISNDKQHRKLSNPNYKM